MEHIDFNSNNRLHLNPSLALFYIRAATGRCLTSTDTAVPVRARRHFEPKRTEGTRADPHQVAKRKPRTDRDGVRLNTASSQTHRRPRALLLQLPAVLPEPPTDPEAQSAKV